MLDKLIEIILEFIDKIVPFVVVPHYDRGVRLRLGNFKGTLEPGFHWKIPFADEIITHMVKTSTIELTGQSIVTKDGKDIVVAAVVKYKVSDVKTLMLEVNSPLDAIADMSKGIVRDVFIEKLWQECNEVDISNAITIKVRREAKKWGIEIEEVTLTDLAPMRSLRLLNSQK